MDWLEQNLDAYRIIAEILNDLRDTFRDELESTHGESWYKTALPEGLLDRLIAFMDSIAALYENEGEREKQEVLNRTKAEVQRIEGEGKGPSLEPRSLYEDQRARRR